jgi:arginine deiminase
MSTDGYSYTHKQNAKNPTKLDSDKLKLYNANGKGNSITITVNSSLQGYNIVTSKAKNTPKVTIEASTDGNSWVTIVDGESPATFTKDDLGSNGYKIIRITNSSSDTSQLYVSEITLTY